VTFLDRMNHRILSFIILISFPSTMTRTIATRWADVFTPKQHCLKNSLETHESKRTRRRVLATATAQVLVAAFLTITFFPCVAANAVVLHTDSTASSTYTAFPGKGLAPHNSANVPQGVSTSGPIRSTNGEIWFAVARSNSIGSVYILTNGSWRLQANFSLLGGVWNDLGAGGPSAHVGHTTLSGIANPVFLFFSSGADSPRLIVVADWRGKWVALPFLGATYGSMSTTTVLASSNTVKGGLVEAAENPCGCASPLVDTWYRFSTGIFRPSNPPGSPLLCSATTFDKLNGPSARFSAVACSDGWALVQGTAATGDNAVALFNEQSHRWVELGGINDGYCAAEDDVNVGIPTAILDGLARAIHMKLYRSGCP
jgi:hypothetical protein